MKKILIIQNDQILGELISAKISLELDYEVEIAYTGKEAKLFLHMYKYFLVLTDLDLEDAPKADIGVVVLFRVVLVSLSSSFFFNFLIYFL